jgi:hypothetical protein
MIAIGALRIAPTSRTARVFALAVGLVLAFVCQPAVAHAAGNQFDVCPQIKLEGQRFHASVADAAITPARLSLGEPTLLARVVHPDGWVAPAPVVARPASPRAPPTA